MHCIRSNVIAEAYRNISGVLKEAQAWDIRERAFYTNQTCTGGYIGDWREKKMTFRKLEPLFEGFRYEYLFKRMLSMRLITKKFQDSPKKVVWDALGSLIKGSRKIYKKILCFKVFIAV